MSDQITGGQHAFFDRLEMLPRRRFIFDDLQSQIHTTDIAGEKIVEVMRNRAREQTQAFGLAAHQQDVFQLATFGFRAVTLQFKAYAADEYREQLRGENTLRQLPVMQQSQVTDDYAGIVAQLDTIK